MKFKIEFEAQNKDDAAVLCDVVAAMETAALEHGGYGAGIAHLAVDLRSQLRTAIQFDLSSMQYDLPADTKQASPS
jgi:hypothetical protein